MNNWEMNDGAPCGRILCIFFKIFSKKLWKPVWWFSVGGRPQIHFIRYYHHCFEWKAIQRCCRVLVLAIYSASKILLANWKEDTLIIYIYVYRLGNSNWNESFSEEKQWQWILMNALNEFKLCFYKGLKSGSTDWKEDVLVF